MTILASGIKKVENGIEITFDKLSEEKAPLYRLLEQYNNEETFPTKDEFDLMERRDRENLVTRVLSSITERSWAEFAENSLYNTEHKTKEEKIKEISAASEKLNQEEKESDDLSRAFYTGLHHYEKARDHLMVKNFDNVSFQREVEMLIKQKATGFNSRDEYITKLFDEAIKRKNYKAAGSVLSKIDITNPQSEINNTRSEEYATRKAAIAMMKELDAAQKKIAEAKGTKQSKNLFSYLGFGNKKQGIER